MSSRIDLTSGTNFKVFESSSIKISKVLPQTRRSFSADKVNSRCLVLLRDTGQKWVQIFRFGHYLRQCNLKKKLLYDFSYQNHDRYLNIFKGLLQNTDGPTSSKKQTNQKWYKPSLWYLNLPSNFLKTNKKFNYFMKIIYFCYFWYILLHKCTAFFWKRHVTIVWKGSGVADIISNIVSCQHATMITNDLNFATRSISIIPKIPGWDKIWPKLPDPE